MSELPPRILSRLGVGAGMTVMPSVFGAMSAALLFGPRLAVATIMKFADNGFQYTILDDPLLQPPPFDLAGHFRDYPAAVPF